MVSVLFYETDGEESQKDVSPYAPPAHGSFRFGGDMSLHSPMICAHDEIDRRVMSMNDRTCSAFWEYLAWLMW